MAGFFLLARLDKGFKVVSQRNFPVYQAFSKYTIILQARAYTLQCLEVSRVILELVFSQLIEGVQSGALIGLGKQDIETENTDLIIIKQMIDQPGQLISLPGKTPNLGQ